MQNPVSGRWSTLSEAQAMCDKMNAMSLVGAKFWVYENTRTHDFGCVPRGLIYPKSYRILAGENP